MLKGLEELAIIMVINQARCQGGRLGNLRWGGGSGSASLINRVLAQQATLSDHTEGPGQSRVGSNGIYRGRPAGPKQGWLEWHLQREACGAQVLCWGTERTAVCGHQVETRQRGGRNQEESHYPCCSGSGHLKAGRALGRFGHFDYCEQNSSETPCL